MNPIAQMFRSKKAVASLTGAVGAIVTQLVGLFGLGLEQDQVNSITEIIVYLTLAYVGSQGLADFGKHRPTNTDFDGSGQ